MKWENEKTHQSLTPSVPQSRTSVLDIDHLTPRCHHIFPPVPVTCLLHQTHLTLIPHFRFLGHFCLLSAISSWLQGACSKSLIWRKLQAKFMHTVVPCPSVYNRNYSSALSETIKAQTVMESLLSIVTSAPQHFHTDLASKPGIVLINNK